MNARDDLNRSPERPNPIGEPPREITEVSVDAVEAGPAGVVEREVTVTKQTPEPESQSRSGTEADLEARVKGATENALHKAADALQGAAPKVGRGAEMAVSGTGSAMSAASGVTGTIVGKIAGRVGDGGSRPARRSRSFPRRSIRRAGSISRPTKSAPPG